MTTTADLERFTADLTRVTDSFRRLNVIMSDWSHRIARLLDRVHTQINSPVVVAGMEGKYLARAALSEVYGNPEGRDWLVQRILAGAYPDTALLSPQNRSVVAAAAIRGWVSTHE